MFYCQPAISNILYFYVIFYTKNKIKQSYGIYKLQRNWFVFENTVPLGDDAIRRRKNNNCKLAEVKQIRLYDFRHSCASLLINNRADITLVAKYLGHSKIDETLNTYSHMFKNKLNNIINIIDTLDNNITPNEKEEIDFEISI